DECPADGGVVFSDSFEQSIDAHAYFEPDAGWLEVNVGGATTDGVIEDRVDDRPSVGTRCRARVGTGAGVFAWIVAGGHGGQSYQAEYGAAAGAGGVAGCAVVASGATWRGGGGNAGAAWRSSMLNTSMLPHTNITAAAATDPTIIFALTMASLVATC